MTSYDLTPLLRSSVGFDVFPCDENMYAVLSKLSWLVTVYVLVIPFACPTTGMLNGRFLTNSNL